MGAPQDPQLQPWAASDHLSTAAFKTPESKFLLPCRRRGITHNILFKKKYIQQHLQWNDIKILWGRGEQKDQEMVLWLSAAAR